MTSIRRVFRVFDISPKIVESANPVTTAPRIGAVSYKNVRFHYGQDCDEFGVRLDEDEPEDSPFLIKPDRLCPGRRAMGTGWRQLRHRLGRAVVLVGPLGFG